MTALRKIVFIDRDGVINVDPIGDYIKRWEDFRFEAGAIEGLKRITELGYEIVVISNQAGIGDGVYPEAELWRIHDNMVAEFKKQGIRFHSAQYCLHGKNAGCSCRKPKTGLFEQALRGMSVDKSKTFFIGDKISDMEAGKRFGLKTIFVRTGHGQYEESKITKSSRPDYIKNNLQEAAEVLDS